MSFVTTPSVIRQVGSLFDGGSVAGLTDHQLIERFNDRRDAIGEAAFAALVTRHGPMVLHVCRQLLSDRHHAEDAFQAVFLVLARKAGSIRDPNLLGNWLFGVALRTARKARVQLARRRKNEEGDAMRRRGSGAGVMVEPMVQTAEQPVLARELAEALHREIDRLPGPFRQTVVLCYLEGLTLEEAARRLRCPAGTVRSRLARACDKLRRGLTRRGVSLSGAALVGALSPRSASASVSSPLCDMTTRAAWNFAAGQAGSPSAAALAQEVLRSMLFHKLKLTAFTLLCLGTVAAGAGFVGQAPVPQAGKPDLRQINPKPDDANPKPALGRMFVTGRVLDPSGKPVPTATVMVYAALKQPGRGDRLGSMAPFAIGQARTDGSGRFRLDASRTSSSTHFEEGAIAIAPGYGAGWVAFNLDADQPVANITLRPEQVIQGRLFDIQGRPVQGVTVSVEGMGRVPRKPASLPIELEGPYFWGGRYPRTAPAWPAPAITDAEGRFTVRGAGRDLRVILMADDPRFARQRIVVQTDSPSGSKSVTTALEPARVITGRVTDADTGKPVPHASVDILAYINGPGYSNAFETDAEGSYRANPLSADRYQVTVHAPDGQPYLNASSKLFDWPKGAVEHRLDLAMHRGVLIHGKVTEEGSGKPVKGAMLGYLSRSTPDESGDWNPRPETKADGSFQFAVLPKPGTLIVLGPSDDYVLQEMGRDAILGGQPGGRRWYAHAFIARNPGTATDAQDVNLRLRRGLINIRLRRGQTVKGRVLGPDGQPIPDALMLCRTLLLPQPGGPWRYWWGEHHGNVRDGQFELHGLSPEAEVPVYFLEPRQKLGAVVNLSGKSGSDGPVTVRLVPCGTATARLVDAAGKPIAGNRDPYLVRMLVTPGTPRRIPPNSDGRLEAEQDYLFRIDPTNYGDTPTSDAQGRIVFPALIPGTTYRIDLNAANNEFDPRLLTDFTVKPGETLDLGDILIKHPRQ